jgi:CRP/FNR family transcriptional regulator, cyclic AMP receptor protein
VSEQGDHSDTLGIDQLNRLRSAGRQRPYQKGEPIFSQGDRPDFAVIIDHGQVEVTLTAETGYTSRVATRGVGQLIGEFGCIVGAPRSASVIALTPVTASLIPSSRLLQILTARPDILLALLVITIKRVRQSDELLLDFGASTAISLVVRELLARAQQHGRPGRNGERSVRLRTTQPELANAVGRSRETVVRALRELRARNLISTGRGWIEITDIELLRGQS